MSDKNKPVIRYDSSGPSGNIFAILGMVQQALRKQRRIDDFNELRDRVYAAQSCEEALEIIGGIVTLVDEQK